MNSNDPVCVLNPNNPLIQYKIKFITFIFTNSYQKQTKLHIAKTGPFSITLFDGWVNIKFKIKFGKEPVASIS